MRKLKSQIIYSFVRVDTVLNSNKVHSGEGPGTELISISSQGFPHLVWSHSMPISTDQVEEHPLVTLETHALSYRHTEALLDYSVLRTVCCESMVPLLFCLHLEMAKPTSITKAYTQSYSLDADNSEDTATYLRARDFQSLLKQMWLKSLSAHLPAPCHIPKFS